MPKLQACAKCGAQFDVAAMAVGQRFTCGACGSVVAVGTSASSTAAPSRIPGSTRAPGASPGIGASSVPTRAVPAPALKGASSRAPQYVPPDRERGDRERGDRERGDRERGDRERPSSSSRVGGRDSTSRKKGLSPAAMAGVGGGILALALGGLYLVKGKDDKQGAGGSSSVASTNGGGGGSTSLSGGPAMSGVAAGMDVSGMDASGMDPLGQAGGAKGTDTLSALGSEWGGITHPSKAQYHEYLNRFKALPGGIEKAKSIATELLKQADPNDKDAHEVLGHKEFTFEVPDEISFKKYPFVRAVDDAHTQRWFDDEESFGLAMAAYEKTLAHAKRLAEDRVYQALDGARRVIDRDEYFKRYNYDAIFASPYLICYSSDERFDPESLIKLSKTDRAKKLGELEKKREAYQKILAEKAKIFPQLYAEFIKRYGEECDLHPLMDEFGGRPDYPQGKQSYREGCPLIVWIFSDQKAFKEYHDTVKKESIDPGVAGYFSPTTGWIYLYDEDGSDREFEVNKNVHEGTHQLQHWFTKQKNEWGKPLVPQSFFGEGFAEYVGSVTMAKDRTLTFVGLNRPRLQSLQGVKQMLGKQNQKLYVFPLKELTSFEGYHNVKNWGNQTWGINPDFVLSLFYIQSWAFVYFLNEHENHKYQAKFKKYVEDMLNYPRDAEGYGAEKFKREMNINTDEDWKKLQKEFDGFYDKLIKMDVEKLGARPPARDDWPDYVAPGVDGGAPVKK